MTSLSSLNTAALPLSSPNTSSLAPVRQSVAPDVAAPSSIVTLGQSAPAGMSATYSAQGLLAAMAPKATWADSTTDAVSTVMAANYQSGALAKRFSGLGRALLDRFMTTDSNFFQSVQVSTPGVTGIVGVGAKADVTLTVQTQNGTKVELALHSEQDGLSVDVKSSAALTDAERDELVKLSGAFQKALDGLSALPPTLDLNGLMQFDHSVLSSVDLASNVKGEGRTIESIGFHADAVSRTISAGGPVGSFKLDIDMHNSAIWGEPSQRAGAVANYLKQFDQAGARGRADDALMSMFKDAFTQANNNYGASSQALPGTTYAPTLNKANRAMLTGLADFDVSIANTVSSPNPRHLEEKDGFSYQASQHTDMQGNGINGTISQQQHSSLNASYHTPLSGNGMLMLTSEKNSQNYFYTQVEDNADSSVDIENKKGRLIKATLNQSASKSTHQSKYEMGNLVSDITTPAKEARSQNLLTLLKPFFDDGQAAQNSAGWQRALSDLHDAILLQPDPSGLRPSTQPVSNAGMDEPSQTAA